MGVRSPWRALSRPYQATAAVRAPPEVPLNPTILNRCCTSWAEERLERARHERALTAASLTCDRDPRASRLSPCGAANCKRRASSLITADDRSWRESTWSCVLRMRPSRIAEASCTRVATLREREPLATHRYESSTGDLVSASRDAGATRGRRMFHATCRSWNYSMNITRPQRDSNRRTGR